MVKLLLSNVSNIDSTAGVLQLSEDKLHPGLHISGESERETLKQRFSLELS